MSPIPFTSLQQYEGGDLDCRGRLRTDASGNYFYRLIRPSNYPVPNDVCRTKSAIAN